MKLMNIMVMIGFYFRLLIRDPFYTGLAVFIGPGLILISASLIEVPKLDPIVESADYLPTDKKEIPAITLLVYQPNSGEGKGLATHQINALKKKYSLEIETEIQKFQTILRENPDTIGIVVSSRRSQGLESESETVIRIYPGKASERNLRNSELVGIETDLIEAMIGKKIPKIEWEIGNSSPGEKFSNPDLFLSILPGLIVFSLIMVLFSSATATAKEIAEGCLIRVSRSPISPFIWVIAKGSPQIFVSTISFSLSILVANWTGYPLETNWWFTGTLLLETILGLVCLGIGVGLIVQNQNQALILSSLLMFLLIIYSGIIFPIAWDPVFFFGEDPVFIWHFLPTGICLENLRSDYFLNTKGQNSSLNFGFSSFSVILSILWARLGFWVQERINS
jgi:ABC-type multidrug transport system permease subunit